MIIGIDVGGTFTDAVLLDNRMGKILNTVKVPTRANNLLVSLEQALDAILDGVDPGLIQRVNLSTTIVTNVLAEKNYSPVGLLIIPGPGLLPPPVVFAKKTAVLSGAIDHRGRVTAPVKPDEVTAAINEFHSTGIAKVAVIGKFSVRNHSQELEVEQIIRTKFPQWKVEMGHRCGSQLNFPRRVVNTVLTAATKESYGGFARAVQEALTRRKLTAPVMILKADGGTLPLEESIAAPVETIFSGPAASVLGALSLTNPAKTGVVVDIGGTTTDLALILSGRPLMSSKGVSVADSLTQVRSFAITALPVGGDSHVCVENGKIVVRPERLGPAACVGGPVPTPTDALKVLGQATIGSADLARQALKTLARDKAAGTHAAGDLISVEEVAREIIATVCQLIKQGIEDMFRAWQEEPAYRVWELLQEIPARPKTIIGVGGGAPGLVEHVAGSLGCRAVLPPHGPVANAIGAAVAKPTVRICLRADTDQGHYHIDEEGYQGSLSNRQSWDEEDMVNLARTWVNKRAERLGIQGDPGSVETTCHEIFNLVRGHMTVGAIHHLILETPWQISHFVGGEKP